MTETPTVRGLVASIQREMRDTDLQPERACQLLAKATALIGNCNDEIRVAEHDYNRLLLEKLDETGKAAHARMQADVSPQALRRREARDTLTLVTEMVRSLKYVIRASEEEMRLGAR